MYQSQYICQHSNVAFEIRGEMNMYFAISMVTKLHGKQRNVSLSNKQIF
jgi:hypothetical protein